MSVPDAAFIPAASEGAPAPAAGVSWQTRVLRLLLILGLAGLALGAGYVVWQTTQAVLPQEKPSATFAGAAEVLKTGTADWRAGNEGRITPGDTLRAVAAVRLIFREGTRVDLEPGAMVTLAETTTSGGQIVLQQEAGRLAVDTNDPLFRLEAPSLALAVPHARYRVDVGSGGDAFVQTDQGIVYAETSNTLSASSQGSSDTVPIAAGESMRTGASQRLAAQQQQQNNAALLPAPPPPLPCTPTPTPMPTATPTPTQHLHTIGKGDTLYDLATQYGTTVDAIIKANKLDNPNMLFIGQQLVIPTGK